MPSSTNEQELLEDLRAGEERAFEKMYVNYFRMVEDLVLKMSGTREDAKDIFQEALLVFVKKIRDPGFELRSKISTFLYAIARNLYLKSANVKQRESDFIEGYHRDELSLPDYGADDTTEGIAALVREKFTELEDDCRNLLLYSFYMNLSHARIAELMEYSLSYVKVKKFRCLGYLRKMVKGSDTWKNIGT